MKSSLKTTVLIIVVLVAIVLTYFYLEGGSPADTASLLTSTSQSSVGANVLSLLNQVQSLRIDDSLFKDPIYKSLVDYTQPIPAQNVGRPNPFAPLPTDAFPSGQLR